jgi:hypothetical protein
MNGKGILAGRIRNPGFNGIFQIAKEPSPKGDGSRKVNLIKSS